MDQLTADITRFGLEAGSDHQAVIAGDGVTRDGATVHVWLRFDPAGTRSLIHQAARITPSPAEPPAARDLAAALRLIADDLDAGRQLPRQWIEEGELLDPAAVARYARLRAIDAEEQLRGGPIRTALDPL